MADLRSRRRCFEVRSKQENSASTRSSDHPFASMYQRTEIFKRKKTMSLTIRKDVSRGLVNECHESEVYYLDGQSGLLVDSCAVCSDLQGLSLDWKTLWRLGSKNTRFIFMSRLRRGNKPRRPLGVRLVQLCL